MQGLQAFDLSFFMLMVVWSSPITAQQCTGSGYSCSAGCTQVILCIGGNQFSRDCPAGSFCDAATGECSATTCPDNTCTTNTFECTAAGTFPDPYSCSNFIKCPSKGGTPTNSSCPSNTKFDPCTASCSFSFDCTTPRVQCNSDFDMGFVPANAEMFYSCHLATCPPVIYKCTDGTIFSSVDGRCIPAGFDVCKEQPYICSNQGFHPDPLNCTVYYYCDPNLILTSHVCKPGYHYVQSAEGCLSGAC